MTSAWIQHVKMIQKEKGISYKEAMSVAKATYNPTSKKGGTRCVTSLCSRFLVCILVEIL